jgi:hypothetical protein
MATASKDGPRALVSIILRGSPKRLAPQDDEVAIPSNNCRIKVVIRPVGDVISFMMVK